MAWVNVFAVQDTAPMVRVNEQWGGFVDIPIADVTVLQELDTYCGIANLVYAPLTDAIGAPFGPGDGGVINKGAIGRDRLNYIVVVPSDATFEGELFRSRVTVTTVGDPAFGITVGFLIDEGGETYALVDDYEVDTTAVTPTEWVEHSPFTNQIGLAVFSENNMFGEQPPYTVEWQVWVPPVSPYPARTVPGFAYEIDKGWSFDGNYIPHFAELNWYFGDNPVDFTGIQKIRVHGLSKGRSLLQVATNGMEPEDLSYLPDYSEPQWCDLPKRPYYVSKDYINVTNYTDTANRGLSIQMKFEGRNTDITKPEPSHVLQVLVLQSSPQGTGARGN